MPLIGKQRAAGQMAPDRPSARLGQSGLALEQ
jgi:hypothetical protein